METEYHERETSLADVHKVLLEMMKTLTAVFENHGLRYALYCGTLLGAIRHGGFIPWDDDADIVMPLKDYRRFLRIAAKELPEDYVLQTPENSVTYINPWAKVYKAGTTMLLRSRAVYNMNWGLSVDIYPMIGGPSASWLRSAQQFLIKVARGLLAADYLHATGYSEREYVSAIKRIRRIPRPIRRAVARFLLRLTMQPPERSRRIGSIDSADFCLKYDRAWWDRTTTAVFEDAEFVIPAEYDRVLAVMYGDYMTPPPKALQYSHGFGSRDLIYDIHKDYQEYREELLGMNKQKKRI